MKLFRYLAAAAVLCASAFAVSAQNRAQVPDDPTGLKDAYKDYFMIGVAVNQRNISDPDQIALIQKQFNSITAENDMKPIMTEPRAGEYTWENADKIADFCRKNGIKLRGHCLMWHSQIGTWIYQDENGNLLPKEEFYKRMKSHIQAVVNRYKDVVYAWDVVNEAVADSPVRAGQSPMRQSPMFQIAGEEFIYKAFEYAHEADPDALLFYNDYNDSEPGKAQRIFELLQRMKAAGVPVHGLGMQGHYNIYSPTEAEIDNAINLYKTVVDHIHITELDVRVNTEQGGGLRFSQGATINVPSYQQAIFNDQYSRIFKVFRKHADVIDCVTFWNLADRDSWLGAANYPLLFDSNYQPKAAYRLVKNFDPAQDKAVIKEDFVPSSKNQPGQQYPMVNSQGYARFCVDAPDAKSVIVSLGLGGSGGTVLRKGDDGKWWGTTAGPMDEGFHYYHLTIDGGVVNDPGTHNYYGSSRWESGIEIPAHDAAFYEERNVPHGTVEQVLFWSASTNQLRRAFVYVPPTYDTAKKSKKFNVLYLQHGWGENEYAWWNQGHANLIMDNLIADGKIEPFLVVMTYGMTNEQRLGIPGPTSADFEKVLCDELVPYIDAHYRTRADKWGRAMAGLSMGGGETHTITLARPEMFGYYGLLSGGVYTPDEIKDRNQVKGIFIGCGSKESAERTLNAVADLKASGFNAKGYISEGTAHEFLTWRRCLYEMAPMLFK